VAVNPEVLSHNAFKLTDGWGSLYALLGTGAIATEIARTSPSDNRF
jgi:hypothetical protein